MSDLTARALAEAAAGVMGWSFDHECDMWIKGDVMDNNAPVAWASRSFCPSTLPDADYCCLEWARENCDYTITIKMTNYLHGLWSKRCYERQSRTENWAACTAYLPGDYARALVAASKEGT